MNVLDLREYNRIFKKKYNNYDLSREYGVGWTTNTNKEFYFDLEDYEKIKNYCWVEDVGTTGYSSIRARVPGENKKVIIHWIIMGEKWYDHIDRNPFNNRKNNLRKTTRVENNRNRSIAKNNTAGITGIYWNKRNNNWRSSITVNRERIELGSYKIKEDAIIARLLAEVKYFGEFAPQRHLFKQYNIEVKYE